MPRSFTQFTLPQLHTIHSTLSTCIARGTPPVYLHHTLPHLPLSHENFVNAHRTKPSNLSTNLSHKALHKSIYVALYFVVLSCTSLCLAASHYSLYPRSFTQVTLPCLPASHHTLSMSTSIPLHFVFLHRTRHSLCLPASPSCVSCYITQDTLCVYHHPTLASPLSLLTAHSALLCLSASLQPFVLLHDITHSTLRAFLSLHPIQPSVSTPTLGYTLRYMSTLPCVPTFHSLQPMQPSVSTPLFYEACKAYGVAMTSRLLTIIGLFCKRAV